MQIDATIKSVHPVNDRPRQYPGGLTINSYLSVLLEDTEGKTYPAIAGVGMAFDGQRDINIRHFARGQTVRAELGGQGIDGTYELMSVKVVVD